MQIYTDSEHARFSIGLLSASQCCSAESDEKWDVWWNRIVFTATLRCMTTFKHFSAQALYVSCSKVTDLHIGLWKFIFHESSISFQFVCWLLSCPSLPSPPLSVSVCSAMYCKMNNSVLGSSSACVCRGLSSVTKGFYGGRRGKKRPAVLGTLRQICGVSRHSGGGFNDAENTAGTWTAHQMLLSRCMNSLLW